MGFKELFASSLGDAARAKASLVGGMSGWLNATLATVQAAGPVIREQAYSALWAEVDSTKELTPLTAGMLLDQLRADLKTAQVRAQKCTPASTSRFCQCGGLSSPGETKWVDELVSFEDCPPGRNLCRNGVRCKRHHGPGETLERVKTLVEMPLCPHCSGTGIIPRSGPMAHIRAEYERQAKTFARPSNPLHEWILAEGKEGAFARRCYNWRYTSLPKTGKEETDFVDASTWMAAAQILFDDPDASCHYLLDTRDRLNGGSKGYDDWCRLPPNKAMCDQLFSYWHRKNTPGFYCPEDTLVDFVKPRMGACHIPIEKDVHLLPREWYGRVSTGDTSHLEACLDGLYTSMEEFLDVFYDCAAQFDGHLELFLDANEKPSRVTGKFGGVQILLTTPAACSPAKLLPDIEESDFEQLEDDAITPQDMIPPLFRDNGLSALYANLVLKQAIVAPVLKAHPTQDEIEDQLDHLENKQGGEIVSTPSFIKMLKDKRKEVRGKEFVEGSEGRLIRTADLELNKDDVFLSYSMMDKFRKMGVVKKFGKSDPKLTKVCVDLTNQEEVIKFPAKELQTTSDGVLSAQTFTVLSRPQFNQLNKLAEAGWKEAKSVCLNLHIRSYLPVHLPVYAFCVIMWGHSSNAEQASLSGAYVYLGDQEASVLQLPLLCGYIGTALEDMEAYKRSLVLSTCFFGTSGLSPGQSMFGITAVEFTEYLPTSYGGITHERDSWNQMLRNHQGMEKQRFISGFNVVDFVEAGKERQLKFPEFELQPVPKHQPIVRSFGEEKQCPSGSSRSMRVKTFSSFRAGNIPVGRRIDNTAEAISYELGRATTSETPVITGNLMANDCNQETYCFQQNIILPTAVTAGTILGKIDLIDAIKSTPSISYARWQAQGYIDMNIRIMCHLSANQFCGLALWFVFDPNNSLPSTITSTVDVEVIRALPVHLYNLREPATSTFVLDLHRLMGQTLHVTKTGLVSPRLFIVAATSTVVAWSTAGHFAVEGYTVGERIPRGFATVPTLTYPIGADSLADLDFYMVPLNTAPGAKEGHELPMAFALPFRKDATSISAYSFGSALLSHFLGVSGTITLSIEVVSAVTVTAKYRVATWPELISGHDMAMIPHKDVEATEKFDLKIESAYFSMANFDTGACQLLVGLLSSPLAPKALETNHTIMVRVHGIRPKMELCRQLDYTQRFAWFQMGVRVEGTDDVPSEILIPARRVDMDTKRTVNFLNAFSLMCATTCLHQGDVIIHLEWTLSHNRNASQIAGDVDITVVQGTTTTARGMYQHFGPLETKAAVPFSFNSFAGPTKSKKLKGESQNYIRFATTGAANLTGLFVSIEVLPGFKFWGRSAGPFKV